MTKITFQSVGDVGDESSLVSTFATFSRKIHMENFLKAKKARNDKHHVVKRRRRRSCKDN